MNALQRRLDDARLDLGLTYAQLAAKAGISTGAAQYLIAEPMKKMPKLDRLRAMSRATGIPFAELHALAGKVFGIYVYERRGDRFEIHVASSRPLTADDLTAVEQQVDALEALLADGPQAAAEHG
jgi:transcriptional regulator with XRE-family HTH domain